MGRDDIERLEKKLAKNPESKLFVPLAEEYHKAGMIDEAISILIRGLEKQPHYLSARVSLGRMYMSKGLLSEAREEFQKVIAVIPDNLYAHKKMAEIYAELGERENEKNELEIVLNLNPSDEWALARLAALERASGAVPKAVTEEFPSSFTGTIPGEDRSAAPVDATCDEQPEPVLKTDAEAAGARPEERFAGEEEIGEEPTAPSTQRETPEQPVRDIVDREIETPRSRDVIADAEEHIKHGEYREAMNAYRTFLAENPGDRIVLQRIAELKALLKVLGKDQDAHIEQLETFLEKIKKRGAEFLGNV